MGLIQICFRSYDLQIVNQNTLNEADGVLLTNPNSRNNKKIICDAFNLTNFVKIINGLSKIKHPNIHIINIFECF
jgi:hypothetical protein